MSLSLAWLSLLFRVQGECSKNELYVTLHLAKLEPEIAGIAFAE